MSIIRDNIEYYRLPPEIKSRLTEFDVEHTLLDGHEEKFYYALNGSNQYTMLVDMFTSDGIRYHRKFFTYNSEFRVLAIAHEYDYGKKTRQDVFVYGFGVTDGAVIRMDTSETDSNITWGTPDPSTGWPYYDFGGRVISVSGQTGIYVDNYDPRNPIVNIDYYSIDFWEPALGSPISTGMVLTSTDGPNGNVRSWKSTGPVISSVTPITGGISGGNISKTGANQLTITPISCLDSNGNVALYTDVNRILSIPSGIINQIYHIFVVRLVADGSMIFKAYTTEAAAASDGTIDAYRWVDYWATTNTGACRGGITRTGTKWWNRFTENRLFAAILPPVNIITEVSLSAFIPNNRYSEVLFGSQGNEVQWCIGYISGIYGASQTITVAGNHAYGIGEPYEWGYLYQTESSFIPIINNAFFWGRGSDMGNIGQLVSLAVHAVKLIR